MTYAPGALTGPLAVTGPLTDTQLRASVVPVSLVSTTITGTVAVTGPLTDTQLRASAVPVNGTITANAGTGTFAISAASLPLPTGAATETTLAALNTKVTAVNTGAVTISTALPAGTNALGSVSRLDVTSSGTITAAAQSVALALNGKSGAAIQITGTWVGTLQFEGTVDGTTWVAVNGVYAGASTPGPTITANGLVRLTPSGLAQLRITATAWTSGTATISMRASDATGGTFLNQSLTAGTNVIGKVGIASATVDAGIEPFGALAVNAGFQTLFYDEWPTNPIDTVDKWTVTGTTPVVATGNMTMVATLSTYNAIQTKDAVRPNVGFSLVRNGISIETAVTTGCGRFWGLGTPATVPAPAVLAQNGIGYELDQATGALLAVTYAAGVRTTIATLTRPADGATHAYGMYFRVTQAYWILDGVTVASQSFPNIQVAGLPALIVRQNAAAFTGTPAFVNIAHLTADTSRQGMVIADPVVGTRQARVNAAGAQMVVGPTLTKATQSATGFSTQDLKDSGRVIVNAATAIAGVTCVTAEALLSLNISRDGVATAAATSHAVTSGKRWRITGLVVGSRATGATVLSARVALRMNPVGAVTTASPIIAIASTTQQAAALAEAGDTCVLTFSDGIEVSGTMQIGLSQACSGVGGVVYVSLIGYEY